MRWEALETEFLRNSLRQYLVAAGVFLAAFAVLRLLRRQVLTRLRDLAHRAGGDYGALYEDLIDQLLGPGASLIALYAAVRQLEVPALLHRSLYFLIVAVVAYRLTRLAQISAAIAIRRASASQEGGPVSEAALRNATYVANALIAGAGVLMALGNLGVNVSALIAGLGIGGVAVALAAQAVLGDLFAAVAIFLDRPFVVGDAVALDKDWQGTVERIGLKTTRLRSTSGELLILPNSQLTSSKLRNYRHLQRRRVAVTVSVDRGTDPELLRKVKALVAETVKKTEKVSLDRVHVAALRDRAADFEVVYHVQDGDYGVYMDANEKILLGILESLRKEGVKAVEPS